MGTTLVPRFIRPKKASRVLRSPESNKFLSDCRDGWLLKKVEEVEKLLKDNRELGRKLPDDIWPKPYVKKWGLINLYKCDLGRKWRMTYTLITDLEEPITSQERVVVFVLEVLSHPEYNRRFRYRKG